MTDAGIVASLAVVAAAMSVATAIMLKWAALAHTGLRAAVVLFLLLMMTGMLVGAAIYFVSPSPNSLVVGLWVAAAVMSVAAILVFAQFIREAQASQTSAEEYQPTPLLRIRSFQAAVVVAVIGNELLMGWTFQRAAGGAVWLGSAGVGGLFANLLVSPWFVLPMAFEMACTLAWLRAEFPRPMIGLLAVQPIVMFASPPTFAGVGWVVSTAALSSAAMAAAVGYLLLRLFRGDTVTRPILWYANGLYASFALMASGLAVWALTGQVLLYAIGVACQMAVFLLAVVAPARYRLAQDAAVQGKDPMKSDRPIVNDEPASLALQSGPELRAR